MKIRIHSIAAAVLLTLSGWSSSTDAQTCPSASFPPFYTKLVLHNAVTHTAHARVYLGRIKNFFGTGVDVLGACIEDTGIGRQIAYVITDDQGNLLAGLPSSDNYLCLDQNFGGAGPASTEVLWKASESHCDIEFTSFNYSGGTLTTFLGSAGNHFHGGAGMDIVYGGAGSDDLNEDVHEAGFPTSLYGAVYAGDGNDFLVGQYSNSTLLRGGAGIDKFYDGGGNNDRLFGDGGSDCCIYDRGHAFAVLDGGTGSDGVKNFAGTTNCNFIQSNSQCTMLVAECQ